MKTNDLKTFLNHRNKLLALRDQLRAEADEIDRALGTPETNGHARVGLAPARSVPRKNAMSLREAVAKVTSKRPLTKQEVLQAVQDLGYVFTTKKPINSLNALIYPEGSLFRVQDGKVSAKG